MGLNTPPLFSVLFCSYLSKKFALYDSVELALIFITIMLNILFIRWLRIQNAKRMSENRAFNYFNLNTYDIESRDAWIKHLPKYLGYFIKFLLKIWDFMGYFLEKLKRPFRWIKIFFKIK